MSRIPYRLHHEKNLKGLVPGSGTWMLKSNEFVDWSQSNNSSIFWLVGTSEPFLRLFFLLLYFFFFLSFFFLNDL